MLQWLLTKILCIKGVACLGKGFLVTTETGMYIKKTFPLYMKYYQIYLLLYQFIFHRFL